MPTSILVGDTIRVQVTFRNWETIGEGEIVDPEEVYVDILDASLTPSVVEEQATPGDPEPEGDGGVYYYEWTPSAVGTWYIEFKGIFGDGQTSVVREEFNVVTNLTGPSATGETLEEDFILEFATTVSPLYVDPEDIKEIYPDASTVEAMEAIHRFSIEVEKYFKGREPSFTALEYIRAAALCTLSKVHDYGINGDENSISLGDLSFSTRTFPKMKITRANAGNWCELAAALRAEMMRGAFGMGMREVRAGSNIRNPMPKRKLHDKETHRGTRWPN